jgi:hypothetical protein
MFWGFFFRKTLYTDLNMANITSDEEEENDDFPLYSVIIFGIIISMLIMVAIIGNVLTIVAYIRDKKLHSVYNTFLLNLSVTDLLLATVSMTFYAVYTLESFTWPFGYHFCKVYMVIDFTLCLESILMIMIISFDRLFLLILGPHYTMKVTMIKAYVQIGISWIIAFLLYGLAIIGWDIWTGENVVEEDDCDVQFALNTEFTTTTAFIEFGIPFICIGTVSFLIYHKIRQRTVVSQGRNTMTYNGANNEKPKRDLKAAKFLASLVIVFFVTWAPYTVTTIIIAFCDECVNTKLYEFFNWLLWSKAAMNPFLYAYNSERFKKNFKEMIPIFKESKKNIQTTENTSDTINNVA